ncbi:aminoglycoside phosphotransferase [Algimonas arctica]|uniref:Aminoglycoside phosphotransferase n=1 Tax=Algimonas arctica TaxID=1479486 RepID=A0A8J3CU72_9PROT|nr:phosphotransferase [Algimonas arctica]GHB02559.1 aminoglycoside phosphotransferase [Algimonas arctica]
MSERRVFLEEFVARAGWGEADREDIQGDASTRSYSRLTMGDRKAVLMNAPKGDEDLGEPEGASVEIRRALGYNASARLAGPNLEAFLTVAAELSMRGLSAPHIIAADVDLGFALLEDFGDGDFWRVIHADPAMERPLYEAAVDVLAVIYRSSFPSKPSFQGHTWHIREYDEVALLAETDLFLDFYAPDVGRPVSDVARAEFYDLWRAAFVCLEAHAPGLCLRDFHAQNLFWLPDRKGQARIGLIDFQDALMAHPAYDLASFLEDARRDVDPELYEPLKQRFCEKAGLRYDDDFQAAYAVMAAQRNTKVIGFPVRADVKFGKPQYRSLIPRVRAYLKRDLSHPACAGLRRWFEINVPEVMQ